MREALGERLWTTWFSAAEMVPSSGVHVTQRFRQALLDHSLPAIRFHNLRHATATFLALEKEPVAVTMAVLGHSNASTTLEIYTRVAPDLAREAAEAMDRVLAGESILDR